MRLCIAALLVASASACAEPASTPLRYTLDSPRTTSAGVYRSDGTLLRTLWRGERRATGTHEAAWDGRDDTGAMVAEAEVEIRVLAHDVRHVWEGTLGNTSARAGAKALHKAFLGPTSIARVGERFVYAAGYNEGQSQLHGFDAADPQRNIAPARPIDPYSAMTMVAADGQRLYWVNSGGLAKTSFVAALDVASGAARPWPAGDPVCLNRMPGSAVCYPGQRHDGVLGVHNAAGEAPSGIAVTAQSAVLAVAWPHLQQVRLFDKASGQRIGQIDTALVAGRTNQLAMAPDGDLWVLGPDRATRYAGLPHSPHIEATAQGLQRPLAIAVDGDDVGRVWIVDGAPREQLLRFSRDGVPAAAIGRPGDTANAALRDDRFSFDTGAAGPHSGLAIGADGAPWLIDAGTHRIVRIGVDGRIAAAVGYVPATYVSVVDPNAPTRVFANFLEYEVRYEVTHEGALDRPLGEPGAWRLVRNWLPALPPAWRDALTSNLHWGGFRTVRTLRNGRTYAVLAAANGVQRLLELEPSGRTRALGRLPVAPPGGTLPWLHDNGDLGWSVTTVTEQTVWRRALEGFDADGAPRWSARAEVLATAPAGPGTPHHRPGTFTGGMPPAFPLTGDGQVVFFDPSVTGNDGFHLGAVALGGRQWRWQASPSGPLDAKGSFQTRRFDASVQYGGNGVMAQGEHIVFGYHGEFWRDPANGRVGQANQFMHFHASGLFIGQFGTPSTRGGGDTPEPEPGRSGNAFSPSLVTAAGRLYLLHNDESSHGGIHRWRIDRLATIRLLTGRGAVGSTIVARQ